MLRKKLEEITEVRQLAFHPALLAATAINYPHSITLQASPHPIERYTCLVHVLDFTEQPSYVAIANYGLGRVFAGSAFAHWLLAHDLLVCEPAAGADSIVLYLEDGCFAHAGLWRGNDRVLSKWGTGNLFEHGLFEVPSSYGTEVRFFRRMPYREGYGHFLRFARQNGIRESAANA